MPTGHEHFVLSFCFVRALSLIVKKGHLLAGDCGMGIIGNHINPQKYDTHLTIKHHGPQSNYIKKYLIHNFVRQTNTMKN